MQILTIENCQIQSPITAEQWCSKFYPNFFIRFLQGSDAVFPGFLEFPGIGKFPGIRPNFPGIPKNLKKTVFSPYLEGKYVEFAPEIRIF